MALTLNSFDFDIGLGSAYRLKNTISVQLQFTVVVSVKTKDILKVHNCAFQIVRN